LPSQLGGGDLDGDIYNLILDETLYPPKEFTAFPGEYVALPPKETTWPCRLSDVADFVIDYIKSDLVGYIAILHLRIGDLHGDGLGCEDCMKLSEHASHAVDFVKRGVPVDFKNLPKAPSPLKPDYLSGEGVNPALLMGDIYYPSVKILGQLYRSVPDEDYRPDPAELEQQRTDGAKIQTALRSIGLRRLGLPSLDPPDEKSHGRDEKYSRRVFRPTYVNCQNAHDLETRERPSVRGRASQRDYPREIQRSSQAP